MTTPLRPGLILALAGAAALWGCTVLFPGSDGGPPGDAGSGDAGRDAGTDAGSSADAGLPVAVACTALNARRCEYLRQCGLIAADDDSTRACVAWLTATWCGPTLWPSRVNPLVATLRYDPAAALGCADGFLIRACSDFETLPAACSRFLYPNAYTLQACYDGYSECTEGVCRGAACPRSCQPRGNAGEVCRLTADCRSSLYCKVTNTAAGIGLCTALGGENAACDSTAPCASNLTCIAASCQFAPTVGELCPAFVCEPTAWCQSNPDGGMCALRRNQGAPCTDDVQCLDGLLCDALRLTCEPRVLSLPGDACTARQVCPPGSVCVGTSAAALGSCASPRAEGNACGTSGECLPHLACVQADDGGSVCGGRLQAGASCIYDRDCQLLARCKSNACVALPATGAPCDQAQQCLWGPCATLGDGGALCVEPWGPGVACQADSDCASGKCIAGRCLASCAP